MNANISNMGLVVAADLRDFEKGIQGDSDCSVYQQSNGERDYPIRTANRRPSTKLGDKPLAVGVDVTRNAANYTLTDPGITAANKDQKYGWDAYLTYG